MDKIIFKDNTELEIKEGASLSHIEVETADATSVLAMLTSDNVSSVTFTHDGLTTATYENLVINSGSYTVGDSVVILVISLREKTEMELRLEALESAQSTQDGAIEDLATAVSDLAEG